MAKEVTGYSRTQIILHWVVAALMIIQFVFHEYMVDAWRAYRKGEVVDGTTGFLATSHVWIGIAVGLFALWRLWLRFTRGAPPAPADEPQVLRILAAVTHIGLYLLMLAMPLSGIVVWFFGIRDAGEAHEIMRFPLIALFLLHVGGALAHRFFFKSGVMERMVRPQEV